MIIFGNPADYQPFILICSLLHKHASYLVLLITLQSHLMGI